MKQRPLFKRCLAAALLAVMLPLVPVHAQTLKTGDKSPAVLTLKQRLFDLGYLPSVKKATNAYTKDTASRVADFQRAHDLEPTGRADEETLSKLYDQAARRLEPDDYGRRFDKGADEGPGIEIDLPALDEQGFMLKGSAAFVAEHPQEGRWLYIGQDLKVDISRFSNKQANLEWFEVTVKTRNGVLPKSMASQKDGFVFQSPVTIAKEQDAVVAFTDDFYGFRRRNKQTQGVIVRDGEVKSDRTKKQNRTNLIDLEVLALFSDGHVKTFNSDAYTGKEYIAQGVQDTFAFGPVLVQEGKIPLYFYSKDYHSYREPRCAFGYVAPGEYKALIVTGRKDKSKGAYFGWMAERMYAMGCTEAMNLDGGGTVALVFQGQMLNRDKSTGKAIRNVSGMIGFTDGK